MRQLQTYTGAMPEDNDLIPWVWVNQDTQTHVWKSRLESVYPRAFYKLLYASFPWLLNELPKVTCPPGSITMLSHRYYTVYTRDNSGAKGCDMQMNEAVEAFSLKSITRGPEAHENKHEKRN